MTQPKGELISQKSGRCSTFLSQPHLQPLLFDAKSPLTSKNSPPILRTIESNVLSNAAHNAKMEDSKALIEGIMKEFGRIDILVNNAGTNP